ncbi:MAG: DEAD/DEAH box helicase family protein, partial [Holophagales bacterium]|nr:DEAD/DEAH box helicase family protein [Holophagales bacterium]
MSDSHLHLVAAPGAGKTVLGLEVIRRLDKKTLVLAPTLTVRNQWIHHFENLFQTGDENKHALVSSVLAEPALLTVATYQSLHSAHKNRENGISGLTGFEVLVLDEAHHLRNEWWKVLVEYKKRLGPVKVVALTATPPYDVSPREWNRYFEMCGPIDSIVSIPELVREGNLCPHEDFVHFCLPSELEHKNIRAFRRQVKELKEWLLASRDFARSLLGHPWVSNFESDKNQEDILSQPAVFAAHVVFLHALGHDCVAQKEFLGVSGQSVPDPADEWFEVLLTDMISGESGRYDTSPAFRKELNRRLSTMHAVERKKVTLTDHRGL